MKHSLKKYWTESIFLSALQKKSNSEKKMKIAKKLIDWARSQNLNLGETIKIQSFTPFIGPLGTSRQLFEIKTNGKMWIDFKFIHRYLQFSDSENRQEFINRLNQIQGARFSVNAFDDEKNLPFDLDLLVKPENLVEFITFGTWFFDKLRKGTGS